MTDADGSPTDADGLDPDVDVLASRASGFTTDADGLPTDVDGLDPDADVLASRASGFMTDADRLPTDADGLNPDADVLASRASGFMTDAVGLTTDADGLSFNNANFLTLPDGQRPRMQMYLWNTASPLKDGDFDSGIIIHEFGHGISNRLVGGPSNVSCLQLAPEADGPLPLFAAPQPPR